MENKKKKRSMKHVALCLALTALLLICGGVGYVLAQLSAILNIGGQVSFNANNVYATIFDGAVSGGTLANAESKLKNVVFDMNDTSSASTTALATWSDLDIDFNQNGDDVAISFKVSNNHTEKNLKLSVGTIGGTPNNVSQTLTVNGTTKSSDEYVVLATDGAYVKVVITFSVIDKNQSASIDDFSFNFNLENTTGEATVNALAYRYTENGTGIYFGSYPQTIKASTVEIVDATPDETTGYYTGSDGEEYAKYTVDYLALDDLEEGLSEYFGDALNMNLASDGTHMQSTESYYFMVEDLEWRIISTDDSDIATVVCTSIIKGQAYQPNYTEKQVQTNETSWSTRYFATDDSGDILKDDNDNEIYANNYKYSALRKYLTNEFYNSAFTTLQQALIQEIEVDNSAESTGNSGNEYACENTSDKVWALSYAEMMNLVKDEAGEDVDMSKLLDYLFATTDYAKATNAATFTAEFCNASNISVYDLLQRYGMLKGTELESMTYNDCTEAQKAVLDTIYVSGGWWLRSPDDTGSNDAYVVYGFGLGYGNVLDPMSGVVPALQIQL